MPIRAESSTPPRVASALRRKRIVAALIGSMMLSPGCAAFRPLRGVPASHVPQELLGESREGRRTINLSLLVRSPVDQHRVEGGDILAIYIPGLLGTRSLIGPALGRESVGEAPPITAPANTIDPPTMGYPITVRDDHTLVLPQLPPINVQGMTLHEVEVAIGRACQQAQLMQMNNSQIMVSLWRPREYRVMVVRQEATESTTAGGSGQGTVNPGVSKRGTGQVVRLRAYENDVLHALTSSSGGNNGLPGLDAENAIYIIRRNKARSASSAVSVAPPPVMAPPIQQPQYAPAQQPVMQRPPVQTPPQTPAYAPEQRPANPASPPAPAATSPMAPQHSEPRPPVQQPYAPPERIQYGTPQNGMPILPQSHQIIRGQSPQSRASRMQDLFGGHSTSMAGHSTQRGGSAMDVRTAEYGGRDVQATSVEPASSVYSQQPSAAPQYESYGSPGGWSHSVPAMQEQYPQGGGYPAPHSTGYGAQQGFPENAAPYGGPVYDNAPPSWNVPSYDSGYSTCQTRTPIAGLFPEQFNYEDLTIDSPNVIRIPIRLGAGETPNICEEDVTLYDGDIVFIESRESEVFYTGGLLGGGEYQLPRDRDLHVLEAVSIAQSRVGGGGGGTMSSSGGVSALNSDVTISPSRVIIRRRLEDGRIVPIEVDLYRARLKAEEDIIIQPRDLVMLQYKCGEATLAFIERHLLAGALFGVAAAQLTTGNGN
ncbi:hypothetical protein Pan44_52620 [Caulifigura coniformis]|uniref:Polysaccharide biosynthesis/export protein n=1 Tax=Caulifigura coniformis TaxID=2527983 RepID=A0A517SM47_9PLAN|nr:hypothetical protein [Caulifigura coniformis]QDT57195.1 hypothetical protein Pan44_52620 [Caulifigura coniformis]